MRILITGAGGFLGTEFVRQLAQKGQDQVTALTSRRKELLRAINNAGNVAVESREAVLGEGFDFSVADILVNCAFPRNADGVQMAEGLKYISDVLNAAVAGGVKRVINISSQSVYSQAREKAADESAQLNPESKYAVGKYAAELLTNTICRDIPHTNIRLASLIGAGFDERLVNKFVKLALSGADINVRGGKQIFGFLDVRDAASAIIRILEEAGGEWDEVYNVGPERNRSLLEIARCVRDTVAESGCKKTGVVLTDGGNWQNSGLDSTKFRRQFGWKEVFSLEETIKMIIYFTKSAKNVRGG